jgi:predicted TIM-barrel fold metal-dependent hydrolase
MIPTMTTYDQLLAFINDLHIIDTHEHLPMEHQRSQTADVLEDWLIHYFSCDLVSAGLSDQAFAQVRDSSKPLTDRWNLVEPYWEAARSTGYGRALDIAARDIYGVDGVRRSTIHTLNEAFVAARKRGNHYHRVLKEKSRIALSIVDSNLDCDRAFFASVVRPDEFVMPSHRQQIQATGGRLGVRVHRLEDWEETLRRHLEDAIKKGAVAIKVGLAYQRPLYFAKPSYAAAEEDFSRYFSESHSPAWRPGLLAGRALQDYMMHAVLRFADQRALTVQFHTGLQEGNGNLISDSNPVLLTNLLLEYANARFDLFHMGYPYVMELGNLAKNFRNVFIDMCWGHIISPEAARRALVEWLDAVPANKISAFGGDYCFVDGVYGHQFLARRNVASALATKVSDGTFDLDRAKQIAQWLFVDNPTNLFRLTDRL